MSKSRDAIEAQRTALSAVSIGTSVQAYDADTAKLDVEQTYTAAQTFGTVAVTGNVDGRDVSVDGAKLDGIAANATADQTGAQIKTAYQAETNAFTDAQFTKLAGVAASANNYSHPSNHAISVVTGLQAALDAKVDDSQVLTNVPSGALFTDTNTVYTHPANHAISVVTGLQTALDAALPKAGGALTGAVTTNSTFDGRDVAADGVTADAALPKAGGTMTGDVSLGDNVKAKFGASDDLQIYHDGSNSYIKDAGTGALVLNTSQLYINNPASNELLLTATENGGVTLYHDNAAKLATTSTGVAVTGSTAHTAGDITNSISGSYKLFGANGTAGSTAYVTYCFEGDNNTGMNHPAADNIGLVTGGLERLRIDSSGIIKKPYQPCFSAGRLSPSQNITAGTQTFVSLNTKEFDIGNNFNTSTYRFTAPVAGRYLFTAAVQFSNTGGAHTVFKINGGTRNDGWVDFGDATASTQSRIYDLVSGDYVQLAAYHTVTNAMSHDRAKMTGFLIG